MNRKIFRTSDMGLVAFLNLIGLEAQDIEEENNTVYWMFFSTDTVLNSVDQYSSGQGRVEPREYNRRFAAVKRQFHMRTLSV